MATKKKANVEVAQCNQGTFGTCGTRTNKRVNLDNATCRKFPNPWFFSGLIILSVAIAYALIR